MKARGSATRYSVAVMLGILAGATGAWLLRGEAPRRAMVTTHGEWVRFKNASGDSIRAYVAYPERKDKAPGIIVIHEIFGLTDWEPTVADRLAGAGYVAVLPDLLSSRWGASPANPDSGRKLTALLVPDQVTADLDATYRYLTSLPAVRSSDIGTIGFCWGGGQSFRYATNNSKLKASVVCYGVAPDSADLPRIKASILGVYGENDARIDESVPGVDSAMKRLGKRYEYDFYPGTGHGFLKPGRQGSDTDQPEKAWTRILGFYHDRLGK